MCIQYIVDIASTYEFLNVQPIPYLSLFDLSICFHQSLGILSQASF